MDKMEKQVRDLALRCPLVLPAYQFNQAIASDLIIFITI